MPANIVDINDYRKPLFVEKLGRHGPARAYPPEVFEKYRLLGEHAPYGMHPWQYVDLLDDIGMTDEAIRNARAARYHSGTKPTF